MSRTRAVFVAAATACIAILALWVSGQSFWIDECNAAVKAIQPDYGSFLAKFSGMRGSDYQMPLYMHALWVWEKLVGRGEWALRAMNVVFAAAALLLVASRGALSRQYRLAWCVFSALSPMLAGYMDEARPYALQFLAATALFLPFVTTATRRIDESFDFRLFSLGLVLLCASSLTGVVFAFWPCLWLTAVLVGTKRVRAFVSAHIAIFLLDAVLLGLLGAFYFHTLRSGARASAVGTTPASLAFCIYEFFGFMGVGPSRLVLRESQLSALLPHAAWISLYAFAILFFAHSALRGAKRLWRSTFRMPESLPLCFAMLGVLSMVLVGLATGMRLLARHLMPALPVVLFLFSRAALRVVRSGRAGRLSLGLLLSAMAISSLTFRFHPRHAKDDYRRAAAIAGNALEAGLTVWWAADGAAAEYYGLADGPNETLVKLMNPSAPELETSPTPGLVVLSKPDIYDAPGNLRSMLGSRRMALKESFPGFWVYESFDQGK